MNDEEVIDTGAEEVVDQKVDKSDAPQQGGDTTTEATESEVKKLYEELGIKAKVPKAKASGGRKAADVRAKDDTKEDAKSTDAREKGQGGDAGDKADKEDAPHSDKNGDARDKADKASKEERKSDREVSDKPDQAGDSVRKGKSEDEGNPERGSEEDAGEGDGGSGQGTDDERAAKGEGEAKRQKSNPEVERRFQKLNTDIQERDRQIEELQRQLQEQQDDYRSQQVEQEDPEYTLDDFRDVFDQQGNRHQLDDDQAELAYRRWKDGYDQRAAEREQQNAWERQQEEQERQVSQALMQRSADAYDTLTSILDDYPELNSNSPEFDEEFSAQVFPLIENMVQYEPGTEPGNPEGNQAVIVGMRMNPKDMLAVMGKIRSAKRAMPLNGIDDNVDTRSGVSVPHHRSSDPDINAANELYAQLGIKKRL